LVLCGIVLGCSGDSEPAPTAEPVRVDLAEGAQCAADAPSPGIFVESAAALGIDFVYEPMLRPEENNPRLQDFSGVGVGDLDGDGALDLYFSGGGNPDRLYLTGGRGPARFQGVDRGGGEDDRTRVVTLADIDGDGDLDGLVASDSPYSITNDGGRFAEPVFFDHELATPDVFYNVYGFAAGDVDGDSRLDVLVAVHEQLTGEDLLPGAEWLQRRASAGYADLALPPQGFEDKTFLAMLADFDDDGDLDIYEVNDAWSPSELGIEGGSTEQVGNRMLRNDDGSFTDVTTSASGLKVSAMGAALGDYDNDGLLDVYVTAMTPHTNTLLRNVGQMDFVDVTFDADADTLYDEHDVGWGAEFFDANADGWLDLYVLHGWHTTGTFRHNVPANADDQRNVMLFNDRGRFEHDSGASGLDGTAWSRSPALGDLNRDGFVDVVVGNAKGAPYVYLNGCDDRPWLSVRLRDTRGCTEADPSGCNTHGIGARVRAVVGELTQTRVITAGGHGLFGSSAPEAYFGFPVGTDAIDLQVRWPDGLETTHSVVPRRHVTLTRE